MHKPLFSLLTTLLLSLAFAVNAEAADIAVMFAAGARSNSATTDIVNASTKSMTSFDLGILGVAPMNGSLAFRSGFMVTQRYVELGPTTTGTIDIHYMYIDVPLTPMYLFTSDVGVFAGPVIAMNVSKDCSASSGSCGASNLKSVAIPWTLGVQARFFNQVGAELFFEKTPGDLSDHVSDFTTVGANFLYYFD